MVTKFFKEFAGSKSDFQTAGHESTYANNIVFIKDEANSGAGACIYARGSYFGNFAELIGALTYIKSIKVGENTYSHKGGAVLEFASGANSQVVLDVQNGKVTVSLTPTFVKSVNDVIAEVAAIKGDYLTSADRTALEGLISTAKAEILGNAQTDTKDSKTIEGVRKYVDAKTSDIASNSDFSTLKGRVDTIEEDYLKTADKNELANSIKAISDDYLKGADKTALQNEIDVERKRIDALANDHVGSEEYAALGERITNEAPVTMTEAAGSGDILKTYTFTQNGKELGKINIAKELVVTGGDIVVIDGVKNLQLTIANQTAPVNIPVNELVDAYSGSEFVSISDSNVISVDKAGIIAGLATDANAQKYAKDAKDAAIADADGKLANKANSADVYTKGQTYTQTEVNNLLAPKANSADVYTKGQVDAELAKLAVANNVYTKGETDNLLAAKANAADVYTKTEADGLLANKANAADVFTKAEVEAMFAWETIA